MQKVDRISLADVLDEHFCVLNFDPAPGDRTPEDRVYRNKRFRTLDLSWSFDQKGRKRRIQNLLELKNGTVMQDLRLRFTDDHVHRVNVSRVEGHFDDLQFGWADVFEGAMFFVVNLAKAGMTSAQLARWLNRNLENHALVLEGKRYARVSFVHENDFVLTKLKFT